MKLTINTLLASNLLKAATPFLHLFFITIKINIKQIRCLDYFRSRIWYLDRRSHYFFIILLLTISSLCFKSDLTLWKKDAIELLELVLFFVLIILEGKSFYFWRFYLSNTFLFTVIYIPYFLNSLIK